jgi:hypothetical protein
VTRKTRPLGLDRYENSAEHSWQIALLASSLAPYAESAIDINRVIAMVSRIAQRADQRFAEVSGAACDQDLHIFAIPVPGKPRCGTG